MSQYTTYHNSGTTPFSPAAKQAALPARDERQGGGGGGSSAPLGTIARFPSPASQSQTSNGQRQVKRFALQAAARSLLPGERVAFCLRRPIPGRATVDVFQAPIIGSAHFGGLQVCGSVWMCPVCSAKITERRRVELQGGLACWCGRSVLVTFTLAHNRSECLPDVLGGLLCPSFSGRFDTCS